MCNEELHNFHSSRNIIRVMKYRGVGLLHRWKVINSYRISVGKPAGIVK
jgi:hypothetical protein